PLCNNLPTRLENALIMSQDPKGQIIGIIRNAAGQARAAGAESYRENEKDFQKLFAHSYRLAWGKEKVKADAFLTGTVISQSDLCHTKVVFEVFDATSWKQGKLKAVEVLEESAEVSMDRGLLSDLGYGWATEDPLLLRREVSSEQRDRAAVRLVRTREKT